MEHFVRRKLRSMEEAEVFLKILNPKRTVFCHIEESFGKSYDDYKKLAAGNPHRNIEFAYDGMILEV